MNNSQENKKEVILGIDPGTLVTGYGVIESIDSAYSPLDYGCIRPPQKIKLSNRYLIIYEGIEQLIARYSPNVVVVETQYVHKNVQSAIKLGMARGMAILAATKKGIPVVEYAPTVAKKAVVGAGRASKWQVQSMVQRLLNLKTLPQPEDAADALALAMCHAHALKSKRLIGFL
jgi:crossover junction endodeoxyribonuclease RuvC